MVYDLGKLDLQALIGPVVASEDALARLDERVTRSEVRSGFAERADFFEAVSSLWVAGKLVHLEDLVLHDAQMDIRAPSRELVIAHRIVRARRRISRNNPGWAVSRSGIETLAGRSGEGELLQDAITTARQGTEPAFEEETNLPPELAAFDDLLKETEWLVDKTAPPRSSALRQNESLLQDRDRDETQQIADWLQITRQVEALPATLAAAVLMLAWDELDPLPRQPGLGTVLVADYLRLRGKMRSHLLAYAVGLREVPRERRLAADRTTRLVAFLDVMSAAAMAGMKDIDRLTLAKRQLERKALGKRSTSSLPSAIDLLLSRPIVSAQMIAKAAKITPRGALNLVRELGVREMTGRGRYRAWGLL